MSAKLLAITMNTANLAQQVEFYKALGFDLEAVKISKGSGCYRAFSRALSGDTQDQIEIKLFGLETKNNSVTPILQLQFAVSNLDQVCSSLANIQGVMIILDPTDMPDGRKAIIKDPDGNSVELVEIK